MNNYKCNFHYVTMLTMTSQILKSVDLKKKQKSIYLENGTLFFLQIKKSLITHQGFFMAKNSFVAEVTFKANHLTYVEN